LTKKLKPAPLKKKPGYPKGRKRSPDNVLAISNAWRTREKRSTKVTINLTRTELEQLTKKSEAAQMSAAAYVKSTLLMSDILELPIRKEEATQ